MTIERTNWAPDIAQVLASGPGERVVFAPPHTAAAKLAESLAALANGHGGALVVGVTASGRVVGVAEDDLRAEQENLQAAALMPTPPLILPLPRTVEYQGKQLCIYEVPPGLPHVFSLNGRYLVRAGNGNHNRLLTAGELSSLLLERSEAGFEARPAPGATLDDLDPAQVEDYANVLGPAGNANREKLLLARGCLTETSDGLVPTNAGILLFGHEPQRFFRNADVVLVRYRGPRMGDEFLRQDAGGTLPAQIRQAEAFVMANMRRGVRLRGFARDETTEYPIQVVREALVNAIAHRDYSIRGEGIRVLLFSDHMEVYSPGRLPGHVTLDNMVTERFSRNEAIVQALAALGYVERLGYGIDRMMAAMAEAGLPAPVFEETVAGFRVTLRGRGDDIVSAERTPRWSNAQLTPRQEGALAYVIEHGSITNREFRELYPDISDETVRRDLAELVDKGLIMKVGDRRATYYILK